MHNGPLVHTATNQIYKHSYEKDNSKNASRAQRLRCCLHTTTCVWRASFEEIYAVVYGSHEGYGCLCERIFFAEEGYYCCFAPLVGGRLLGGGVVIVIVIIAGVICVVVVIDAFSWG